MALAAALPDLPRWVETRWLLRSGEGALTIGDHGDGGVVVGTQLPLGAVIGRADPALLRDVLAEVPDELELIVQMDALHEARQALRDWTVTQAIVHCLPRPYEGSARPEPGVVVSAPPEERWVEQVPREDRPFAARAPAVAVRVEEGSVVAVCMASAVTEALWDVGVDNFEGHRRRGHAAACFRALAAYMASHGRQPVWAAEEDNTPSRALAARLGFRVVDRVAVLSRPDSDDERA
ncbi:MAG: GNAT family N-acetyltransferase [Actinomycetota bacterium]|nr:GNAT family N-acetyltransferase [Actinomycetota bacterium]